MWTGTEKCAHKYCYFIVLLLFINHIYFLREKKCNIRCFRTKKCIFHTKEFRIKYINFGLKTVIKYITITKLVDIFYLKASYDVITKSILNCNEKYGMIFLHFLIIWSRCATAVAHLPTMPILHLRLWWHLVPVTIGSPTRKKVRKNLNIITAFLKVFVLKSKSCWQENKGIYLKY